MKKFIVITTLLLASGCASHNTTPQQLSTKQERIETNTARITPKSNMHPSSSISTNGSWKSSIRMKQLPEDISIRIVDVQRNPYGNAGRMGQTPYDGSNWARQGMNYPYPAGNRVAQPAQPQAQPQARPQTPPGGAGTAAPPAAAPQPGASSSFEQQVLNLVNQERAKAGLNPLSMSSALSKVAMTKAQDMYNNNYFDHQSPTYGSPFDMMKAANISYNTAGENIAKGQRTPEEVMNAWMNSPGHRANILKNTYTQIGVAYYKGEWVQEFTG